MFDSRVSVLLVRLSLIKLLLLFLRQTFSWVSLRLHLLQDPEAVTLFTRSHVSVEVDAKILASHNHAVATLLTIQLYLASSFQESDPIVRNCTVLSNLASQLFFPVEHIAWLAEHGIISTKSDPWWSRGIKLWAASLALSIIRSLSCSVLMNFRSFSFPPVWENCS